MEMDAKLKDNVIRPNFGSPRAKPSNGMPEESQSVATAVVPQNPLWDIDLGAEQGIGMIRLRTDPGKVLRDFWIFVSKDPFGSKSLEATLKDPHVWRVQMDGPVLPLEDVRLGQGVNGRFVRLQSTQKSGTIPLAEMDIHLPKATHDLLANGHDNALTINENGWTQTNQAAPLGRQKQRTTSPTMVGFFQDVKTAADKTYVLSFDRVVPRVAMQSNRFHVWWNGQLLRFSRRDSETGRFVAEVKGSGGSDRLLFREDRSNGGGILLDSISLRAKTGQGPASDDKPDLIDWAAFRSISKQNGAASNAQMSQSHGDEVASRLASLASPDEDDEIVFV